MIEQLREAVRQFDTALPIMIIGSKDELLKMGVPIESLTSKQWFEFQIVEVPKNKEVLDGAGVYLVPTQKDKVIKCHFEY